jgi:hypothetical protein
MYDENQELLDKTSLHTVALIARIYTNDSSKYKVESDYWLSYFLSLAYDLDDDTSVKQA